MTIKLTSPTQTSKRHFILGSGAVMLTLMAGTTHAQDLDLATALAPRIIGAADAPIHIAEYFSMSCSHCADFHRETYPELRENWIDTGRVRFEYRDFPLSRTAIFAHALARAVPVAAYENMLDLLLKEQQSWAFSNDPISALAQIARIAGIGRDRFKTIIANRSFLEGIIALAQQGQDDWGIRSTPSFVINNDKVISGNHSYNEFIAELGSI